MCGGLVAGRRCPSHAVKLEARQATALAIIVLVALRCFEACATRYQDPCTAFESIKLDGAGGRLGAMWTMQREKLSEHLLCLGTYALGESK